MIGNASGTLIRTARGDVAVEHLSMGDIVVTASGAHRPIRWLGHRTLDCRNHAEPLEVWPVCVSRDAFGPGLPASDLLVSPDHALALTFVEEMLVPAGKLVNGSSVAFVDVDDVTYWHVELDSHDLLLANGLAVESFVQAGENRRFFAANGDEMLDSSAHDEVELCRPLIDDGLLLDAVRAQVEARATRLGWIISRGVSLSASTASGMRLPAHVSGGEAFVCVPEEAGGVTIETDTVVPATIGGADWRRLGIALYRMAVEDRNGAVRSLDLDSSALRGCFHDGERAEGLHYRWTKGKLVVPAPLFAGVSGPFLLHVSFEPDTVRKWQRPGAARVTSELKAA